jgi:putative hemolysin
MIKMASIEGIIEKEQNIIHENIFYFSDKRAKHIMTPRRDVEWVDISKPAADIYNDLKNVHHSKVICCRGDLENFTGVLFIKDYYKAVMTGERTGIEQLIAEPHIVPETTYAQNVLKVLRDKRSHLCFVVNEYGGFEGIITIHDIIENIIGQIPYEGDISEPDIFVRDDKSVLVSGDAPVESLTGVIDDFTIDSERLNFQQLQVLFSIR